MVVGRLFFPGWINPSSWPPRPKCDVLFFLGTKVKVMPYRFLIYFRVIGGDGRFSSLELLVLEYDALYGQKCADIPIRRKRNTTARKILANSVLPILMSTVWRKLSSVSTQSRAQSQSYKDISLWSWFSQFGVEEVDWPLHKATDLNPIHHLWEELECRQRAIHFLLLLKHHSFLLAMSMKKKRRVPPKRVFLRRVLWNPPKTITK